MTWLHRCTRCGAGYALAADLARHQRQCQGRVLPSWANAEREERERDWWQWWDEKRRERW